MARDKMVAFRTTQEVIDQIDFVAAKYGQTRGSFIHTILLRGVFGHIYTIEDELYEALKDAIGGDVGPIDIKMLADMIKNLLYRIAEERR